MTIPVKSGIPRRHIFSERATVSFRSLYAMAYKEEYLFDFGYSVLFHADAYKITSAKDFMVDPNEWGGECLIISGKVQGEEKQVLIYRDEMDGPWARTEITSLLMNFPLLYRGHFPKFSPHYHKLTAVAKYPEPHEYYVVHEAYKQDRINTDTMKFMEYVPKETVMERVNFDPALEDESIPEDFPRPVSWDIFPAAAVLRDPAPEGSCLVMHGKHEDEWKFIVVFREAKYGEWIQDEFDLILGGFHVLGEIDTECYFSPSRADGGYVLKYAPQEQSPLKCEARLFIYSEPKKLQS